MTREDDINNIANCILDWRGGAVCKAHDLSHPYMIYDI